MKSISQGGSQDKFAPLAQNRANQGKDTEQRNQHRYHTGNGR
jgi:hypothetical protein